MKRTIIISATAILLQVLYYLSMFEVISINFSGSFWVSIIVTFPVCIMGYNIIAGCVKHSRKWHYNTAYTLVLGCAVVALISFSGVHLASHFFHILFATIYPLSYGAYIYCDTMKSDDSWYFVTKNKLDSSLIVDRPEGIEQTEAVIGRSYIRAHNLQQKNEIFSTEVLQYAQGEFETLKKYLLAQTTAGHINLIIEQPTVTTEVGEILPMECENPHIYCDGSENAILVYNSGKTFGLDYMNKEVSARVNGLKSILVLGVKLDFDKSRLVRTFYAPITRICLPEVAPQPKLCAPQPQIAYATPLIECTREEMLSRLPHSSKLSKEKLFEIKEQLVGALQELSVDIKRVKMNIGEESVTCQLRYDTISTDIRASGFPCNINIFYRLLSIDREEKVMTIDIPYKKHALLC